MASNISPGTLKESPRDEYPADAGQLPAREDFPVEGEPKKTKVRKVRKCLDLETKLTIIRLVREGKSHISIAKEFDVTRTTISKMLKNASKIESGSLNLPTSRNRKSLRLGDHANLEQELFKWYADCTENGSRISGCMIKAKAAELAANFPGMRFKASNGWLDGFKGRFQISSRRSGIPLTMGGQGDMSMGAEDEHLPMHGPHLDETAAAAVAVSAVAAAAAMLQNPCAPIAPIVLPSVAYEGEEGKNGLVS
eukprot:m.245831 g.245831  ORF g.245831 m.245831 type:complete len:252 (-) comp14821_c0_seq1:181-936(-)